MKYSLRQSINNKEWGEDYNGVLSGAASEGKLMAELTTSQEENKVSIKKIKEKINTAEKIVTS